MFHNVLMKCMHPNGLSWDEFLGIMRSYQETQQLVVHTLGIKSLDDYILFVRSDPSRAQGLRIPLRPDLKYKNQGWIDEATFFSQPHGPEDDNTNNNDNNNNNNNNNHDESFL